MVEQRHKVISVMLVQSHVCCALDMRRVALTAEIRRDDAIIGFQGGDEWGKVGARRTCKSMDQQDGGSYRIADLVVGQQGPRRLRHASSPFMLCKSQ
jgi:hypothetical protein